jgi:hypothetical protein
MIIWGDDSSWKLQYLDLSQIRQGIIHRDDRFGYVELATEGFESPCFTLCPPGMSNSPPPRYIKVLKYNGATQVDFAVPMKFDIDSGKPDDWKRLRIANME